MRTLTAVAKASWRSAACLALVVALVTAPTAKGATKKVRVFTLPDVATSPGFRIVDASVSDDGRYLLYTRPAPKQGFLQVELLDTRSRRVELISASPKGQPGNGNSGLPQMTGDARFVVFSSQASNLTRAANPRRGVFVRDRRAARTYMVSRSPGHAEAIGSVRWLLAASISADGQRVRFTDGGGYLPSAPANFSTTYSYVAERWRGRPFPVIRLASTSPDKQAVSVTQSADAASAPQLSADGLRSVFVAEGRLPAGVRAYGVYLQDLRSNRSVVVSPDDANSYYTHPSLDAAGTHVTFESCPLSNTNPVWETTSCYDHRPTNNDVYYWSSAAPTAVGLRATHPEILTATAPTITGDGKKVVFLGRDSSDLANSVGSRYEIGQWSVWRWTPTTGDLLKVAGLQCASVANGCALQPPLTTCVPGTDPNAALVSGPCPYADEETSTVPTTTRNGSEIAFRTSWPADPSDHDGGPSIYVVKP